MELKDKIARLAALIDKKPKIESEPGLSTLVKTLEKAIDTFLSKSEAFIAKSETAAYRNTAEYPELIALLMDTQYKSLVTPDWLNDHARSLVKKFAKAGKKEKEEFTLIMVKSGAALALIKEMKDSPRRRMEDELNRLALATDNEISARLKAMKPAQIQEFCEFNGIAIARNAKGSIDKKKTQPYILQKLSELREYTKLSRP
jgi:hypothetical protein